MTRNQYKPGRRRSGSWQWAIIGLVIGFGCAIVLLLAALTFGILEPNFTGVARADLPTQTARVVTATHDANVTEAPTQTPFVITATPNVEAIATLETGVLFATDTLAPAVVVNTATPDATNSVAGQNTPDTSIDANPSLDTTPNSMSAPGSVPAALASIASQLVPVEGGTFMMGTTQAEVAEAVRQCLDQGGACVTADADDSTPAHQVTLDSFLIESTEVTYAQYTAFLNYVKSQGQDHRNGCGSANVPQRCTDIQSENSNTYISSDSANYFLAQETIIANTPVVYVTWYGADSYCRALGRRLPTEAEWERAARGIPNYLYPWGNEWNPDNSNTSGSTAASNVPVNVESYLTGISPFSALNMAGNAAEWVNDWYAQTYYSQAGNDNNPTGPLTGVERVLRGGSYAFRPFFARSVHRLSSAPDQRLAYAGFRCAADGTGASLDAGFGIAPLSTTDSSTGFNVPAFQPPAGTLDPASLGNIGGTPSGAQPTLAGTPVP